MSTHLLETHIHTFLFPTQTLHSRNFTTKKSSFCLRLCNKKKSFFSYVSVIRSSVTRGVNEVKEDKQLVVKKAYPFHEIEPKWQSYWEENRTFRTPDEIDTSKPKFYVLDMFPYPRFLSSSKKLYLFLKHKWFRMWKSEEPVFIYLCFVVTS